MELMLFLLVLAFSTPIEAFFPTTFLQEWFGHSGISHELITQATYSSLVAKHFPSFHPGEMEGWDFVRALPDGEHSNSMVTASQVLVKANREVDLDPCNSARHSDGENLHGSREILIKAKAKIIHEVKAGNGSGALELLGDALHPLQDFYAHSNYVELGHTKPFQNLHIADSDLGLAAPDEATCKGCSAVPTIWGCQESDCFNNTAGDFKLTTGYNYFEDSPSDEMTYSDGKCHTTTRKIPPGKCHHGGPFDKDKGSFSALMDTLFWGPTEGINKDSFTCTLSPHFHLHFKAAKLALAASIQYVEHIMNDGQFTDYDKRVLLGVNGGTLAFALDTTSRSPKILNAAKQRAISIAESRRGTNEEPLSYIITEINDKVPITLETSDFDKFVKHVNTLEHRGSSGACSKPVYSSIIDALSRVKGAGSLIAVTDADAKDSHRRMEAENLANEQNMQIHLINHSGDCNLIRSQYNTEGEEGTLNSNLAPFAKSTGGAAFDLNAVEVKSLNTLMDNLSQVKPLVLLSVSGTVTNEKPMSYDVPLDTTMDGLNLFFTGSDAKVSLIRPDGFVLSSEDTNPSPLISSNLRTVQVGANMNGVWRAIVSGTGAFQLRVQSTSQLRLKTFEFVENKGRPGHQGYFPIEGPPEAGRNVTILAKVIGNFSEATFSFRDVDGTHIADIPMKAGSGKLGDPPRNHFIGTMQLPNRELMAYVTGTDYTGVPFQRVHHKAFYPIVPALSGGLTSEKYIST